MTIKEVEQLTGMTRANIRFYESEGLLAPERNSNGYRVYSEKDVDILKKIKLLRMLHISLEQIKEIEADEKELSATLEEQLRVLEEEKNTLSQAQDICRLMRKDEVKFDSLNAGYYLEKMDQKTSGGALEFKKDELPKTTIPVRRFFARSLDFLFYGILWDMVLTIGFHANLTSFSWIVQIANTVISLIIGIVCETILISKFGTTLGKWILGIEVVSNDERRLTLDESYRRTVHAIRYGYGLGIPYYTYYCQWKNYRACVNGETLRWEEDSMIILRDKKMWRNVAYIIVFGILCILLSTGVMISALPDNRGEISVEEFAENYNQLNEYYDNVSTVSMNEKGQWFKKEASDDSTFVIDLSPIISYPEIQYVEENSIMKSMTFTAADSPVFYENELKLSMKAYINAKEPQSIASNRIFFIYDEISSGESDQQFILYGVKIEYTHLGDGFTFTMKELK